MKNAAIGVAGRNKKKTWFLSTLQTQDEQHRYTKNKLYTIYL